MRSILASTDFNRIRSSECKLTFAYKKNYSECSFLILDKLSLKLSTLVTIFSSNNSIWFNITKSTPSDTPALMELIPPAFLISSRSSYFSIGTSIVTFLLPSLTILCSSIITTVSTVILINSFFVFLLLYILVLIYNLSSFTQYLKRVTFIYSGVKVFLQKIFENSKWRDMFE